MKAKTIARLLFLPCFLLAGAAPSWAAPPDPSFLDWIQEPERNLLHPRQRPPLGEKAREELLQAVLPVLKRLSENDSLVLRGEALMTLATLTPDQSIPKVLAALESEEETLQRYAILAAGLTGHNGALLPLEQILARADRAPSHARLAAVAIGLLGPGMGTTALNGQFRPALDRSQKALAPELLAMLAGLNLCARRGDAAPLIFVLEQDKIQEPAVHQLALWLAARLDPAASSRRIEKTLRRERELSVPILACLAFPGDKEDKDPVQHLIQAAGRPTHSPEIRIQALVSLGSRKEPASLQALQRLAPRMPAPLAPFVTYARGLAGDTDKKFIQGCLEDLRKAPAPSQRAAAALAIGAAGLTAEGIKMRHAFEAEKDPVVKGAQAMALALLQEIAVAGLLGQAFLETDSSFLRRSCALALAQLAPGRPLPGEPLELSKIQARPGAWAPRIRYFGMFGGADVKRVLLGLLAEQGTSEELMLEALRALRVLGDPRSEPPLARLLLHDSPPMPVTALSEARRLAWGPSERH